MSNGGFCMNNADSMPYEAGSGTFWMMDCALPGSPLMSSCTILAARSTASWRPEMFTRRGWPSG